MRGMILGDETYATDVSFRLTHESASDLMTHGRYIH